MRDKKEKHTISDILLLLLVDNAITILGDGDNFM